MPKRCSKWIRSSQCLAPALALALSLQAPAHAAEQSPQRALAIGMLAHDHGPLSDHHEEGTDLNLEIRLAPLDFWASPRPHAGITLNFDGDTSVAYAGLSFRFHETARWFVDGFLSAAVHDGPLHKDPVRCQQFSDCGYGTRVMPRFGLELGYRIGPAGSLSLFFDHMSHKWVIEGENEGLDHIGLRYLHAF